MILRDATETLAGEFSVSRPEAQRLFGDQVLEGLLAHGFAIQDRKTGRYGVGEAGRRLLADKAD
jgi:hypothetical protein